MVSLLVLIIMIFFSSSSSAREGASSAPTTTAISSISEVTRHEKLRHSTADEDKDDQAAEEKRLRAISPPHADSSNGGSDNPEVTGADMVAFSSRIIAAARAMESRRVDRLFDDPFAEILAGSEAMNLAEERMLQQKETKSDDEGRKDAKTSRRLSIRTRFCDDFFEDYAVSRGIKQIVLLGAGMDTRGLRLKAEADTKVFEVDQTSVLTVKRDLLSSKAGRIAAASAAADESEGEEDPDRADRAALGRAKVVAVEADLSKAGWEGELLEAGFDRTLPSAWILEGFAMYLEENELVSLLRVLANLCSPGSALCCTFVGAASVDRATSSDSPLLQEWKFGSDDAVAFLKTHLPEGWSFDGVTCGTPGNYPEGADYGVGFKGKGPQYVVGRLLESSVKRHDGHDARYGSEMGLRQEL